MQALLGKLQEMYRNGANPAAVIGDLINLTHALTKTLLLPGFVNDASLSENDRNFLKETSGKLSIATLPNLADADQGNERDADRAGADRRAGDDFDPHRLLRQPAFSRRTAGKRKNKSESGTLRPANSSAGNPSAAAQTAAAPVSAPAAVSTPAQTVVNAPFPTSTG